MQASLAADEKRRRDSRIKINVNVQVIRNELVFYIEQIHMLRISAASFYSRNALLARYMLWPCLFVCPSVTSRCSTKTSEHRITRTTPHNSRGTLVFWRQISQWWRQMQVEAGKNCVFRPVEKSQLRRFTAAENLYPSAMVVPSTSVRWRRDTRCHQQRWS